MKNEIQRLHLLNRLQFGTEAVLSPSAQFGKLCDQLCEVIGHKLGAGSNLMAELRKDYQLLTVVALQLVHNLRISEVLSITLNDIDDQGNAYVVTGKKSRPVVVNDLSISAVFKHYKQNGAQPFVGIDRYYVYRRYKQLGIIFHAAGNKNNSVTHAFRHLNAKQTRDSGKSDIFVTQQLNHKSNKTQEHYGKQETGRRRNGAGDNGTGKR